jgi:hypothetical protein
MLPEGRPLGFTWKANALMPAATLPWAARMGSAAAARGAYTDRGPSEAGRQVVWTAACT